jgi:hypothetical protein
MSFTLMVNGMRLLREISMNIELIICLQIKYLKNRFNNVYCSNTCLK